MASRASDLLLAADNQTVLTDPHTALGHRASHPQQQRGTDHAILLFYLIVVCILSTQSALVYWQQRFRRSYELATLCGLWAVPAIISARMNFWLFLLAWLSYTAGTGFILFITVANKQMAPSTPRRAYMWFLGIHSLCVVGGAVGYVALVLAFVAAPGNISSSVLGPFACLLLWYCLYFGVLNRDCAEVTADRMAQVMGTGRRIAVSVRRCGICDGELADFSTRADQAGARGQGALLGLFSRSSIQLPCKHLFHDGCIRGWYMVGKKDSCPTCMEKMDLRHIFAGRPWEARELSWIKMLDALRYMICWMPIILTIMHFCFKALGLEKTNAAEGTLADNKTALEVLASDELNATGVQLNLSRH